ncbi:arylsulfatase [Simiduia agarivorans]|uniref:Sulfatase n=1 Tax=Simiduia agarivorans (strain DSM 21679 / JCM 13881 / BCRC 17597 / SA1) TaxID=1117647 RepID=K4KP17_SIMAS|nr:arylsulfatase [Simiduia agarivorans]AFU99858.1 sulfatase [Simiduia agarivorans SA1 = DSM 21679]
MKRSVWPLAAALGLLLAGCGADNSAPVSAKPTKDAMPSHGTVEFKGKIAREYENSEEWWPDAYKSAPEGAPNVVLILLDDTGFAQLGSFGGLTETPNLDALAENGLRYNNFHTTALCSPSRASIMAGRNPHSIGLGSHSLTAMGFPGYNAIIPENAKSVAKILQQNGFVNYALGKWDHTPLNEVSQTGPFTRWPSGEGFDHFYGFMAADADQYRTVMFEDHAPIEPWKHAGDDYHNSEDLADKAIKYITGHVSTAPKRPFMVFLAPGGMHSPHQAPEAYLKKYRGKFDMGWDKAREMILQKQKALGIVPANTQMTERPADIPAWDTLNADEKKLYARQMEVFAAMLDHLDEQIGRVVATLKRVGKYDNTVIMVTSDNGASGEGGLAGTFNETYVLNGLQTAFDANMRKYDKWGDRDTYPHYHAGWAMAGNTPHRYFKQSVHRGGIADPLIIQWPAGIKAKGEIRSQYHHIADIAPTILELTGLTLPDEIDGVPQIPMDGQSMQYSFNNASAPTVKKVQYYEMFGNRAIWAGGWKAVTLHGKRMPWITNSVTPFEDDVWELYNLNEDFSGAVDLADKFPEKLEEMKALFDQEAWKYNVYPLYDDMIMRLSRQQDRQFGDQTEFVFYYPGAVRIAEKASPPIKGRSHIISTQLNYTGVEEGVIVACGGFTGGYATFIKDGKFYYDYNFLDGVHYILESPALAAGEYNFEVKFTHTGQFAGYAELFVNGKMVDKVDMPQTHISTFSLSEPFDVGVDNGTPVSTLYSDAFEYTGELDKVVFRLLDK